jgi:hypothetical protein
MLLLVSVFLFDDLWGGIRPMNLQIMSLENW